MAPASRRTDRNRSIRDFVLDGIASDSGRIVQQAAEHFGVSRQTISNHVNELVDQGLVVAEGNTRARIYTLRDIVEVVSDLDTSRHIEEDAEWRDKVAPLMTDVQSNVLDICHYGFTEMVNNVAEHAESKAAAVGIKRNARRIQLSVLDDGIGVFQKLQDTFKLDDPRHALLELSKGKLTSDPESHTGEGIFFTSRMFDEFDIVSGSLVFKRTRTDDDEWLVEVRDQPPMQGTVIMMIINVTASHTTKEVFDQFADDMFGFSRTHIPIELAQYEGEKLYSRSQAKRILTRFEKFREVMLDFRNVEEIGQAFADEIFRVYRRDHPDVDIRVLFAAPDVDQMIRRVSGLPSEPEQLSLLSPNAS